MIDRGRPTADRRKEILINRIDKTDQTDQTD